MLARLRAAARPPPRFLAPAAPLRRLSTLLQDLPPLPRLSATIRQKDGTNACDQLRKKMDLIPGVLYGISHNGASRERKLIQVKRPEVLREVNKRTSSIENTLFELELDDGSKEIVLARDIAMRAATDEILCINFLRFSTGLTVQFPLKFVDVEKNQFLKRSGFLYRLVFYVKCVVDTWDLPAHLEVSCAEGRKNTCFRARDIKIPPKLKYIGADMMKPVAVIQTK